MRHRASRFAGEADVADMDARLFSASGGSWLACSMGRGAENAHRAGFSRRQTALVLHGRVAVSKSAFVAVAVSGYAGAMGLLELIIIILVLAAIFGGVAVSPLLFVLLIVVLVILLTRGGFGYRRGGRL
jgi:hypothetical protein